MTVGTRHSLVSAPSSGLAIVDLGDAAGTSPVGLPSRSPQSGDALVVINVRTGRIWKSCSVTSVLDEDGVRNAFSCDIGVAGQGRGWASESAVVLSARDLSLVGIADGGEPHFRSVRALITTPEAGTLLAGDGRRVVACYNAGGGRRTIREMFDCSGVWVTPRGLARCVMSPRCPTFPDTPVGRSGLQATLKAEGLNVDRVLEVDVRQLPPMPAAVIVDKCNATADAEATFTECVLDGSTGKDLRELQDCIRTSTGVGRADCITSRLGDGLTGKVLGCAGGSPASADAILGCAGDAQASARFKQIQDCAKASLDGRSVARCVLGSAPPEQRAIADCLVDPSKVNKAACLETSSPEYRQASRVLGCLQDQSSDDLLPAASCVARGLPGSDATRVAACLGDPDRETAAACILDGNPKLRTAQQVYRCVSNGRDVASLVENCTQDLGLDPKAQQSLACVARSDGDRAALLECAAGAALPPEAARLVGCVGSGDGPTGFALCAAGPMMNEEWRIAAECAVESGGQVYATAACAATKLTVRELTKCFKGKVGKDCFGPNNTIVVTFRNAFNDVVHGPGKNNEVVKALATLNEGIARISPQAAAFIEKPLGSDKAAIPKARDDLLNGLGVGGTGRKIIENPLQPLSWFN